jgi:hypothetical protein
MAEDYGGILQMLMQGRQPDPAGALFAQAFLEGKMPGDQGANLQTALTMLSPNVIAERRAAEPGIGELLGLTDEESDMLTRQAVGLQLTPAQSAALDLQKQQAMAEILRNIASTALEERKVAATERETTVKEQAETRQAAESEVRQQHLEALANSMNELAASRAQSRQLRNMAYTGLDAEGNPLTPEQQQLAAAVAGINMTNPQLLTVVRTLLTSGVASDREFAAKLLGDATGLDTSQIANPPNYFLDFFSRTFDKIAGPPELELSDLMTGQTSEDKQLQQHQQELLQQLLGALGYKEEQE